MWLTISTCLKGHRPKHSSLDAFYSYPVPKALQDGKREGLHHSYFISKRPKSSMRSNIYTIWWSVLFQNCPRIKFLCIYHGPRMQWFMQRIRSYYMVSHIRNTAYNASQAWYTPLTISLDESYLYAFYHSSMLVSSPKRLLKSLID